MSTHRRIVSKFVKDQTKAVYEIEENVTLEKPRKYEVIIKVKACVLSEPDIDILREFQILNQHNIAVGTEIAGVVIEVGCDVSLVDIGDEVVGILPPNSTSNGCATFCCLSQYNLVKKPVNISFADAACCIGDGVMAYTAIHYLAKLCAGETILVLNGTSGPGLMAIQLAKFWGAKVITTTCSEEETLFLQSFQPEIDKIIELTKQRTSLIDVCLEETGGIGVDCIVDNGVQQFSKEFIDGNQRNDNGKFLPFKHDLISSLAVGGRWVTTQSNLQLDPPHSKILYLKSATVSFLYKHSWTLATAQQGRFLHILKDVLEKVEEGHIKSMVHHTVTFDDTCSALQDLHQFTVGNVVLVLGTEF